FLKTKCNSRFCSTEVVTEETTTTYGFTLDDGDLGDTYTVDVKDPDDGFGPVFSTRGGATSCPYEDAVQTKYFEPGTEISAATAQREIPVLNIENTIVSDIPSNRNANYTLFLRNNSDTGEGFEMELDAVDGTNPDGAILRVDGAPLGNGLVFNVPAGQTLVKTLTLGKGQDDVNDYENIGIVLRSLCQSDPNDNRPELADSVFVSAFFQPGCSDVAMLAPIDNWVLNTRNPVEDVLPVTISDYDLNLETFERIDFQYRASSSSLWITEMSFYNPRQITPEEFEQLDDPKTMIEGATINYSFDMSSLPDRTYDVQAVSVCVLGPGNEVATPTRTYRGTKDTKRPLLFGAPQPADGVLSANDEISIQFDETIEAALLSNANLSIKGVLNNAELTNGVSVNFDGANDYIRIPGGLDLSGRSFTTFSWLRRQSFGRRNILYSKGTNTGDFFEYGFDEEDRFFINVSGQQIVSSLAFAEAANREFEYIAVIFDIDNKTVSAIRNGEFILESVAVESSFTGRGAIALGMSQVTNDQYFDGQLHELRIWTRARSLGDIAASANLSLTGNEIGLAGYWPMDEAFGDLAIDKARFRNAIIYADWNVEPKGISFQFDGIDDFVSFATGNTVNISNETDFSLEFWFKGDPGQREIVFFSNGKGDSTQELASSADTWFVGVNQNEELVISNSQNEIVVLEAENSALDNDWHHFAMAVSRRGNLNAYIDKQLKVSVSSEGLGALTESRMWLGARGFRETSIDATFDRHFKGYMDEFRIWNSFRRQSQIELNWNCRLIGDEVGLVAYYPFERFTVSNGVNFLEPTLNDQFINDFGPNGGLANAGGGSDFETDDTPNVKLARPIQSVDFDFAVNDDELVLTTNPVFAPLIENSVLEISVRTVEDLFENRLVSPVTWTAFVDRNQVIWGDNGLEFSKKVNEVFKFSVDVVNSGGTEQSYTIDNLPPWLSASPASGTIAPQSTINVEFTVDGGLNIGRYEEDVFLSADLGFKEKLSLVIDVFGDTPPWEVNPEQFQFTMSIVGELSVNEVKSYDLDDIVAVFVDDQVRGLSQLRYIQDLDRYLVFLDVYSNITREEELEFRVWDASVGQELRNVLPTLSFSSNEVIGSPKDPLQIIAGNTLVQELRLSAGWNWLSFNVNAPELANIDNLMKPIDAVNGDQFKGQSLVDVFTDGIGWIGTLSNNGGAQVGKSYQVEVGNDGILPVVGQLADANTEIPILEGWNWIGYIPNFNISVDEAFGSINPAQGDIVKSQFAFSVFDEGIGWEGTLGFLEPGRGYLYQSAKEATLIYPENSLLNSRTEAEDLSEEFPWEIDRHGFSSNMTIIASIDSLDLDSLILGSFSENDFRGGAIGKKVGDQELFFLTISGRSENETISFKAFDPVSGELIDLSGTFSFNTDQNLGSLQEPVLLKPYVVQKNQINRPLVFPNPSTQSFFISLPKSSSSYKIEVLDVQGKVIVPSSKQGSGNYEVVWDSDVIPGVYFVRISSDESSNMIKIIKK
ncbi:MAG: LamG-like jellyroll fold domain-containing protein, partial [Bacteroidota bacterium]